MDFKPYLQLDGSITDSALDDLEIVSLCLEDAQSITKELCWDLNAGYQASIGVYLELFGKELSKDNWNWVLAEKSFDIADDCLEFNLPYEMDNFDCEDYLDPPDGVSELPECLVDADCATEANCNIDHCVDLKCETQLFLTSQYAACCNSDADCDDDNPCTQDACAGDGISARCAHTYLANVDASNGQCCISAADCDDDNNGTSDTCEDGLCVHSK